MRFACQPGLLLTRLQMAVATCLWHRRHRQRLSTSVARGDVRWSKEKNWKMNWNSEEGEAKGEEATLSITRRDTWHSKHNHIKQIAVMLWALQLLSVAVGVDCQAVKSCICRASKWLPKSALGLEVIFEKQIVLLQLKQRQFANQSGRHKIHLLCCSPDFWNIPFWHANVNANVLFFPCFPDYYSIHWENVWQYKIRVQVDLQAKSNRLVGCCLPSDWLLHLCLPNEENPKH